MNGLISRTRLVPGAVALLALWAGTAFALEGGRRTHESDHDYARRLHRQGDIISLESVVARAQAIRPGELLESELKHRKGGHIYELEILDQKGEVWELKFNAVNGELIEEEAEH